MNCEDIKELAFKNRKELANLNELDLLEIIEFLQLDRKQWINQYTKAHNGYILLQKENQEIKEDIKFCLHSIKQEMHMSRDSRTRKEMKTCLEMLKEWIK